MTKKIILYYYHIDQNCLILMLVKIYTMIVSRGIGNSIIPFRINNRPELIVVELKNK